MDILQPNVRSTSKRIPRVRLYASCIALLAVLVGLSHNAAAQKIYWTDRSADKMFQANLDGTGVVDLITASSEPGGIALDTTAQKIYWISISNGKISRANLDGSGIEEVVTFPAQGSSAAGGIAVDSSGGKLYWTHFGAGKISRANLNGSSEEDLVTGLSGSHSLALDVSGGKLYWTDAGSSKIQRSDLDGANVEDLITGLNFLSGIALDVAGGKMYWLQMDSGGGGGNVRRANLDGSSPETLLSGLFILSSIALDAPANKMYWTATSIDEKIQRANLDGSGLQDHITGLPSPVGLALGPAFIESGPLHVSKSGDDTTGDSWATALHSFSDALVLADSFGQDVWVAGDTYAVSSTASVPSSVNIYGGFPPTGDPGFLDRDPEAHPTILDGMATAAPILEYSASINGELDGITFTNANGTDGGAIRVVNFSNVDILNCRFTENNASISGACIYTEVSSAEIADCVFEDNDAAEAGAIMLYMGAVQVIRCEFRRNDGGAIGGAISVGEGGLTVEQCIFDDNQAGRGGAISVYFKSSGTIRNSLFKGNASSDNGGGIEFAPASFGMLRVWNCTFVDNTSSTKGGGIYLSGSASITNSIFVNNSNHALNDFMNNSTYFNNLFYNNPDGVMLLGSSTSIEWAEGVDGLNDLLLGASGNIDANPVFAFPEGGDYHIRISSLAVDTGSTSNPQLIDFDGELRPVDIVSVGIEGVGVAYDIGYDEYLDTDGDGMPDYWELLNGLNPASSAGDDGALGDADGDGLTNLDEYELYHTGASEPDTDGDGISDGDEISDGTDPLDANSFSTSEIWVDFSFQGTSTGSVSAPHKTMAAGIAAVDASGILHVVSGSSPFLGILSKPMTIVAEGGSVLLGVP